MTHDLPRIAADFPSPAADQPDAPLDLYRLLIQHSSATCAGDAKS